MRSFDQTIRRKKPKEKALGRTQLSTWPFADGFPWDEELIRCGRRAVSTHGPWERSKLHERLPWEYGW